MSQPITVGDLVQWTCYTSDRVWVGRVIGFYGPKRDGVIVKDRLSLSARPVRLSRLSRVSSAGRTDGR